MACCWKWECLKTLFFGQETVTRYSLVQISVDNGKKVTFDDCGNRNYWSYHSHGNSPNVSELFVMSIKEGKAVISGYPLAPKKGRQVKWLLTIREGRTGVLEEYPRFLSEWIINNNTEVEPIIQTEMEITEEHQVTTEDCTDSENTTILHKDFDWQDSPDRNWHFGLSFKTRNRGTENITCYLVQDLVPDSREKNRITISEVPAYPFTKHEPDRVGWTNIVT